MLQRVGGGKAALRVELEQQLDKLEEAGIIRGEDVAEGGTDRLDQIDAGRVALGGGGRRAGEEREGRREPRGRGREMERAKRNKRGGEGERRVGAARRARRVGEP